MNGKLRSILSGLVELVYPSRAVCMGCGIQSGLEEPWLCPDCRERLYGSQWSIVQTEGLDGVLTCRAYSGPAGSLVRNLKYRGVTALAESMGRYMAECVRESGWTVDAVTCVPMHAKRRRQRGYNQSELLAKALARELAIPYGEYLTRTRNTPQQAKLDAEKRRSNLQGAFSAKDVKGLRLLLVDDVFTTGETAKTCAKTLRESGAAEVRFVAYATDNE